MIVRIKCEWINFFLNEKNNFEWKYIFFFFIVVWLCEINENYCGKVEVNNFINVVVWICVLMVFYLVFFFWEGKNFYLL